MNISLRPGLEKFVEEKVKMGLYTDPSDVINNALEACKAQEELPSGQELERLISEGQTEADRGELLDGEEVFRNLLARNAERSRQA